MTELLLKAHQALDVFAKYEKSFTNQMESDILKNELALSFPKESYFSDKKTIQEVMDAFKCVAANHLKDNSDVLLCPAENLIQSLTENFGSYKKSVFEFVEALSERGDSKDDIDKKADMASKVEG